MGQSWLLCEELLHACLLPGPCDNCEHIRVDCLIKVDQFSHIHHLQEYLSDLVGQPKTDNLCPQENHQDDRRGAYSNHPGRGLVSVTFTDTEAIWITFPAQIYPSQTSDGVYGQPSLLSVQQQQATNSSPQGCRCLVGPFHT